MNRARAIVRLLQCSARWTLPAAHALGAALGTVLFLLPNRERRVAAANLALCFPQLSHRARRRLLRHSLQHLGRTGLELGALWHWPPERLFALIKSTVGETAVTAAYAQGRGLILASPHLGAWELAGLYCAARWPLTTLYRQPQIPELDQPLRAARERTGARVVPAGPGAVRALLHALRRGEAVGLLPDQEPDAAGGEFAPFFGVPALTMTLLSRLAARTGAPVFLVYALRRPRGAGYELCFEPLPHQAAASPADALCELNARIEAAVGHAPAQYQWTYKRFKTRPAGMRACYAQRSGSRALRRRLQKA